MSLKLFFPKSHDLREKRTALVPASCEKLTRLGMKIFADPGIGEAAGFRDEMYHGVQWTSGDPMTISEEIAEITPDIVISIFPQEAILENLAPKTVHISLLDAYRYKTIIEQYGGRLQLLSLERIPRSTFAQKMDVLSSQSSLAGYAAVIQSMAEIPNVVPMMTTPAGTVTPQRFLIIGAGVAGLQAIATARRLGANVEAFDTRPEVEEQVKSLGAKFVKIDLGTTGSTQQGYAKALTEEQLHLQREGLKLACQRADVIITTAKVFGRSAPKIITQDMLTFMKSGSLIVDLAVSSGGNVEGSLPEEKIILPNGVCIWGMAYPESFVAGTASIMFAENIVQFLGHLTENGKTEMKIEDPIWESCHVRT